MKIYSTYIRSQFNHLIPLTILTNEIPQVWNQIRHQIFYLILQKQTTPREAAALFSCSYYDIMVKPILKIVQKNQAITTETDTIPFLKELLIKILTEWGILEPNHTPKINQMIENTINKTQWYKVETWSEAIREQAVLRLFKDTPMTNIKPTLKFIKHPQLIYIISNTSKHIIDNILQSFDRYDQPKIEQKIQLKKTLAHLIIISESHRPRKT